MYASQGRCGWLTRLCFQWDLFECTSKCKSTQPKSMCLTSAHYVWTNTTLIRDNLTLCFQNEHLLWLRYRQNSFLRVQTTHNIFLTNCVLNKHGCLYKGTYTETEISFWWNFRHWLHRKMSKWDNHWKCRQINNISVSVNLNASPVSAAPVTTYFVPQASQQTAAWTNARHFPDKFANTLS